MYWLVLLCWWCGWFMCNCFIMVISVSVVCGWWLIGVVIRVLMFFVWLVIWVLNWFLFSILLYVWKLIKVFIFRMLLSWSRIIRKVMRSVSSRVLGIFCCLVIVFVRGCWGLVNLFILVFLIVWLSVLFIVKICVWISIVMIGWKVKRVLCVCVYWLFSWWLFMVLMIILLVWNGVFWFVIWMKVVCWCLLFGIVSVWLVVGIVSRCGSWFRIWFVRKCVIDVGCFWLLYWCGIFLIDLLLMVIVIGGIVCCLNLWVWLLCWCGVCVCWVLWWCWWVCW